MCEHGSTAEVPDLLAYSGAWHRRSWQIDSCIADLVRDLNEQGVETVGSCCGHDRYPGSILLRDGREMTINPTTEEEA